jgi:3-oxoacyl-[acyl-carrier protein] reductase
VAAARSAVREVRVDLELRGKSVLVTGGAKGIGFACAEAFAAGGAALHLAARNADELAFAVRSLRDRFGVEAWGHQADLAAQGELERLAETCADVDILINNAGSIPGGRLDEIDDHAWRTAWDPKVFGYINMTRRVYESMRRRRSGVIVNIIGLGGERHRPQYIAGCKGNAALTVFTRALGAESVDYGVRVVGLNPGRVMTERQESHLRLEAATKLGSAERWTEIRDTAAAALPFGRFIDKREVADMVAFLASARASYMSATVVTLDGGQSLRPRT